MSGPKVCNKVAKEQLVKDTNFAKMYNRIPSEEQETRNPVDDDQNEGPSTSGNGVGLCGRIVNYLAVVLKVECFSMSDFFSDFFNSSCT